MHIMVKTICNTVGEIVNYNNENDTVSVKFPDDSYSKTVPVEDIIEAEVILE